MPGRIVAQACFAGLVLVLCFLFGFSITTTSHVASISAQTERALKLSTIYSDARFAVGQEESLERKYRLEPGPLVRAAHTSAERQLEADLRSILTVDRTPTTRKVISGLISLNAAYTAASARLFRAVDRHQPRLAIRIDHTIVDPIFGAMQTAVYRRRTDSAVQALDQAARLHSAQDDETQALTIAFAVGLLMLAAFGWILVSLRGRVDTAQRAELERLSHAAVTDSLTGLRNHRAFQEELAGALIDAGDTRRPLSLVMLDLDGLKSINDRAGHQAGDVRLQALATALHATVRAGDGAYRIGGDEFAVILPGIDRWGALEFAQRVHTELEDQDAGDPIGVGAGVAQAVLTESRDELIRRADCALLAAKRHHRGAMLYTPELAHGLTLDEQHDDQAAGYDEGLANALAMAVDAKDAYTRSHSQTVSELVALLGDELGLGGERIARLRLAGLLHDVGKIGVPDAILNKPAQLTAEEFERIKGHAVLGEQIVAAAGLGEAAGWIRHHHERYDGAGYPDGLRTTGIPFESRIIFVADAFEAMTSDRPYRLGLGRDIAIAELRRNAGAQFDPDVVHALCRALYVSGVPHGPGAGAEMDGAGTEDVGGVGGAGGETAEPAHPLLATTA